MSEDGNRRSKIKEREGGSTCKDGDIRFIFLNNYKQNQQRSTWPLLINTSPVFSLMNISSAPPTMKNNYYVNEIAPTSISIHQMITWKDFLYRNFGHTIVHTNSLLLPRTNMLNTKLSCKLFLGLLTITETCTPQAVLPFPQLREVEESALPTTYQPFQTMYISSSQHYLIFWNSGQFLLLVRGPPW